jgi:hypothetical protein
VTGFAVAIAEGPIGGIGRIWADGKPLPGAVIRVHRGTESQQPDPHIEGLDGVGNAPAYRGTAYVVFERFRGPAAERFGNRLPQLSFEVFRPSEEPDSAEQLVRAVNIVPSAGEIVYATEPITRRLAEGVARARSSSVEYTPSSRIFRHRNARASALTMALSTRGRGAHGAPSGVTTSFRPPLFLNVIGMWTVIVSPSAETVDRFTPLPFCRPQLRAPAPRSRSAAAAPRRRASSRPPSRPPTARSAPAPPGNSSSHER